MELYKYVFGRAVTALREDRRWSLTTLAGKADISMDALYGLEQGNYAPETVLPICRALGFEEPNALLRAADIDFSYPVLTPVAKSAEPVYDNATIAHACRTARVMAGMSVPTLAKRISTPRYLIQRLEDAAPKTVIHISWQVASSLGYASVDAMVKATRDVEFCDQQVFANAFAKLHDASGLSVAEWMRKCGFDERAGTQTVFYRTKAGHVTEKTMCKLSNALGYTSPADLVKAAETIECLNPRDFKIALEQAIKHSGRSISELASTLQIKRPIIYDFKSPKAYTSNIMLHRPHVTRLVEGLGYSSVEEMVEKMRDTYPDAFSKTPDASPSWVERVTANHTEERGPKSPA